MPQDTSVFSVLTERDVLVHHPYDSFTATVERLVVAAAVDPRVLAIKQTLYRTSGDSPIVDALIDAAEAGKQVVVVVEIKARFDERANIAWARKLEEAGCHVVYGFVGLKTHCKMLLVVREEPDGSLRRFCHIGTGNYHPTTARLYEDFGLLTTDPDGRRRTSTDLFNHLTGYSRKSEYHRLLVAPAALRSGLVAMIEEQVASGSGRGRPARIQMKCNKLIDEDVIDALYRASRDGVPIDLWVRGICGLRPGRARAVADHPGAQRPGPVPRALAGVHLRHRGERRRRRLAGQRRPDAPQPGPPGRAAGPGGRPRTADRAARLLRRGDGRARRVAGGWARTAPGPGTISTISARPCATCRAT